MKVLKSKRKGNVVSLEIEIEESSIIDGQDRAFKRYVKQAKVPGFRKGKISRSIFEKNYGTEILIEESIKDAVGDAYSAAIKEKELFVIDQPKNIQMGEYKEGKPFVFSCEVDVKPEVKLGKYKGLKAKKDKVEIKKEDVEAQIKKMQEDYAKYNPVTREVQEADMITCDITATIENEIYAPWTQKDRTLHVGSGTYGSEFDEQLIGIQKGEEKTFSIHYADDFQDKAVAGKMVEFKVSLVELQEKTLPALDEEFVSKVADVKTEDELRTRIEENMKKQADSESQKKLEDDLLGQVAKNAKVEVQDVLIERSVDQSIREFEMSIKRMGLDMAKYLEITKKGVDEIRAEYRPNAENRIKIELALDAIMEKEDIQIDDADIEVEIKKWNQPGVETIEDVKEKMKNINMESLKDQVRIRKTIDFVVENAKIN